MSKKILALLAALMILSMVAAACVAPAPASQTVKETVVVEKPVEVVVTATPEPVEQVIIGGFDVGPGGAPQAVLYMSGAGHIWYSKMFTPLVMMSSDYSEFVPGAGLAMSWESSEDFTEWTFHLRKNARWSNGDPVTAHDFVYAYNRILNPEMGSPYSSMLYILENAKEYSMGEI